MKKIGKWLINWRLQCNILLLQTFEDRDRFQRPPELNHLHQRNIMGKVQDNPRISAPQIADDLKADYKIEMTPQTVRNTITKAGYNGRAASKKPCNGESASSLQRSI
ncbi:hypothetical protein AVEN_14653-1 [Araneus ventricosus]|uniref:Transposase Tc1-like domain-containing protein n=1 Tax=Araneus ventricosus TaxID=182803 RepID=A0A4Y2PMI2_ARAVE|nr:hypothetical protein AVEN_178616-1 [Araneus ventricosus]GBN52504.1 hypothetical protein AVEN_14653-1 [Araneus ventricosus]